MTPSISIVIPCYNSGKYLPEALSSISEYSGANKYEVIIVDDGSTDADTLELLDRLKQDVYIIIHQKNGGPAAARNTGVRNANAEYILFLDSDNKIRSNVFIDKGVSVLNQNAEVGVYHGNPAFFGDVSGERLFEKGVFDLKRMIRYNYIDMCSMVRKAAWQEVNGLDEKRLIMGHEDWDFWLRIGRTKWQFYYTDEVLFDYRVVANSMVTQSIASEKYSQMVSYILSKHSDLLPQCLSDVVYELKVANAVRKSELDAPVKTFIKSVLVKLHLKKPVI